MAAGHTPGYIYSPCWNSQFNLTRTSTAVPHRLTADDVYNGYHLPAGSIVVGNSWYVYIRHLSIAILSGRSSSSGLSCMTRRRSPTPRRSFRSGSSTQTEASGPLCATQSWQRSASAEGSAPDVIWRAPRCGSPSRRSSLRLRCPSPLTTTGTWSSQAESI